MMLVSVIIPIYNKEKYLERCIKSVINQTYKNFELILINDGSIDNCGFICDQYAKSDERIKVIHKDNGGVSNARNVGINQAKGEYITFIDADDYVQKEFLEKLVKPIIDNNVDVSICGFETHDSYTDKLLNSNKYYKKFCCNIQTFLTNYFQPLYHNDVINRVTNKLLKKSIIDKYQLQFDERYSNHEDRIFMIQIISKSNSIANLDECLYNYMTNIKDSLVRQYQYNDIEANWILFHTIYNFLTKNKASEEIYNYIYNNFGYRFASCISRMYRKSKLSSRDEYNIFNDLINNDTYQTILVHTTPINIKYKVLFYLFRRKVIRPVHIVMRVIFKK